MKPHLFIRSLLVAVSVALVAPVAAGAVDNAIVQSPISAPILFSHPSPDPSAYPDPSPLPADSMTLFRVNPANGLVTKLTPQINGIYFLGGSWSAGGSRIVYERLDKAMNDRSQLYTTDQYGQQTRRITSDLALHQQAVWGPGSWIAFINATTQCLAVVRDTGSDIRTLFCPPFPGNTVQMKLSTPQWSMDGKSIDIEQSLAVKLGLSLDLYSRIYRVNASTGMAQLLYQTPVGDQAYSVAISPDGTRGIYSGTAMDRYRMTLVDFATGEQTFLRPDSVDYGVRYSKDGSHIAFTHPNGKTVPIGNNGAFTVIGYVGIAVMRADGTGFQLITNQLQAPRRGLQVAKTVAGWSSDGSRILVNRHCYNVEHGEQMNYPTLQVVDVRTHATTTLGNAKGDAGTGAWFQH